MEEDERAQDQRLANRQAQVRPHTRRLGALLDLPAAALLGAVAAYLDRTRSTVLLIPTEQAHFLRPAARLGQVGRHATGHQHPDASQIEGPTGQ